MERREFAQEIQMMLAPQRNCVEVVTRSDGGAGHKQQHFGQRIHHPPRLALIVEPGEMLQEQDQPSPRRFLIRKQVQCVVHRRNSHRIRCSERITSSPSIKFPR
jgi:hypothetical protein